MKFLISLALLALAACTTPQISDPRIDFPEPPAELMAEPPVMEPITE